MQALYKKPLASYLNKDTHNSKWGQYEPYGQYINIHKSPYSEEKEKDGPLIRHGPIRP